MSKKPKDKELNKHVTVDKADNMSEIIGTQNGSPNTSGMNGDLDEVPQLYICHTDEEPGVPPEKNKKRINHNATEKNRKDKIRKWINKIGELLPPVGANHEKPVGRSTLEIVEQAWEYINHLKTTNDRLLVEKGDQIHVEEIERLKNDIGNLKVERDRYLDMLRSAGLASSSWNQKTIPAEDVEPNVEEIIPNGGNTYTDNSPEKEQETKTKKTKKRNTISLHLENMKKEKQLQQDAQLTGSQPEMSMAGMMGNFGNLPMNNVIMGPNGQQFINNQNMLMNQMMLSGNQMFGTNPMGMASIQNVNNQMAGQGQVINVQGQGNQMSDKNAAEMAGAGLLQLAMQDAGITPNSNNQSGAQSLEEVTPSAATTSADDSTPKSGDEIVSQPSALQTLASVASNTQNLSNASTVNTATTMNNVSSQTSSAPTATTQAINTNPIMATGQNGYNQQMQQGGNGMMNMQFQLNGQQCFTGNVLQQGAPTMAAPPQTQQVMFLNEQGVPCIANVPLGMDPSVALQKQLGVGGMMATKDGSAMTDQTLLANTLAQQQMNMTLQNQLTGQAFQQQQNAVAMGAGNLMNNPLAVNQQFIQPTMPGLQGSGMTSQQGIIMPASQVNQSGNLLTVNSVPNQGSQLPQALILPNGQIIPVVSNPQMYATSQPQQVIQQTGGSVQWQNAMSSGGQQRMAIPGIQGKMNEGMASNGNNLQNQVLTSTAQMQINQSNIGGLLMTTNSTLPTTTITATTTAEAPSNSMEDLNSQQISASTGQFVESNSANVQNNMYQTSQNSAVNNLEKQQGQMMQGQMMQGQMMQGQGQMTSQGQGFVSMQGLDVNVQNLNNQMMMQNMFNGASNTVVSSHDASSTSSVLPPVNAQLSGQTSGVNNQAGGAGGGGPILLQISCNGQPTSILVDPNTMQVLGTVQTQQSQQQQQPAAPPPVSQPQAVPQAPLSTGKKGKKGNQRAIYPKPSTASSVSVSGSNQASALWLGTEDGEQMEIAPPPPPPVPTQTKKSSSKSKSKNKVSNKPSSDTSESQDSSTDILAKAAESIFSTSLSPPVGGFYNPANEDNPLQIDTSAGETEDSPEGSVSASASPRKEVPSKQATISQKSEHKEQSAPLNQLEQKENDRKKSSPVQEVGPVSKKNTVEQEVGQTMNNINTTEQEIAQTDKTASTKSLTSITDSVVDMINAEKNKDIEQIPDINDMDFITSALTQQKNADKVNKKSEKEMTETSKRSKKSSKKKAQVSESVSGSENVHSGVISPPVPPLQIPTLTPLQAPKVPPVHTPTVPALQAPTVAPSQAPTAQTPVTQQPQEEEAVIEMMPESISFTEKDLSEVLDQVESLGNSLNDSGENISAPVVTPVKKSKSRKNKSNTANENEPASKKSKKMLNKDKTAKVKETVPLFDHSKNTTPSIKSSLSVYDFDDGDGLDDVQTPLLSLHNSRTSSQSSSAVPTSMSMDTPLFGDFPIISSKKDTPKSKSKSKSGDKKRSASGHKSLEQNTENVNKRSSNSDMILDKSSSKTSNDAFTSHSTKQRGEFTLSQHLPEKQKSSSYLHSPPASNARNKFDSKSDESTDRNRAANLTAKSHDNIVPNLNTSSSMSVMEPVHISTTTSDTTDIDNTVNSILGLSAASLSPHIISPRQHTAEIAHGTPFQKQAQRSPVLRTPTSVSPVSMTSVSMANSPPMSQGLQTPKCTSPVPVGTSVSVTKPTSSVTATDTFLSNTAVNTTYSSTIFPSSSELTYSAESLFSSSSDKPVRPDTISRSDKLNDKSVSSKSRTSIYSADNFVHTSKSDTSKGPSHVNISSPLSSGFGRIQNDNSSDGFNFSNIGLSATTPTTSSNSFMDTLSMSPVIATISNTSSTSSFTFTLSSVSSTVTTSSATMPSHQNIQSFPFYQPMHSPHQQMTSSASSSSSTPHVSSNHISAAQSEQPMNMSSFDLDLSRGSQQQSQNPQHSGHDRMSSSHVSGMFSFGMQDSQSNCSLREPPHEQPPFFPNITVTASSSVNKSQSDQVRNTHKHIQDLNMGRNMPSKSHIVETPNSSGADRNMQIAEPRSNTAGLDHPIHMSQSSESRSRIDQPIQLSRSSESRTNVIERPVQMSSSSDNRSSSGHDRPMQLTSNNSEKRNTSAHERTNLISQKPEPRPGSGHMDRTSQVSGSETRTSSMDRSVPHPRGSDNRSGSVLERSQISNNSESRTDSRLSDRHSHMNALQPFFPGSNFPNASSHPLNTPPLHHLPLLTQQDERSNIHGRTSSYEPVFPPQSQGFNSASQNFHGNRYEHGNMPFQQREIHGSHRLSHTPPNSDGRKSANPPNSKSNKPSSRQQPQVPQQPPPMNVPPPSRSTGPTPPHQPPHHRSTPPQAAPPQPPAQQSRQSKSSASRSKQSQKKNKQQYVEMDTSYPPTMFDTNRSLTPFFGLPPQNLSPPTRNMQNEGPLFAGNFFGPSSRPLSNSGAVPKNADIGAPFNSLFPPSRPQNGLGLNFQHGFGMNHAGISSAPQITPHSNSVTVTPHMSNFSLTNIFSEVNSSQNESMNISPIKFPHSNPILPPQGMDPNSLQHPHHQGSSLYHHNRGHHPPPVIHTAMSINSILGHNHHGFDTRPMQRGMNTTAPPFAGHGHPPAFGMPPLDFSMHEH